MRENVCMGIAAVARTSVLHQMSDYRPVRRNLMPMQERKKAFDLGSFLVRIRLNKRDRKLIETFPAEFEIQT